MPYLEVLKSLGPRRVTPSHVGPFVLAKPNRHEGPDLDLSKWIWGQGADGALNICVALLGGSTGGLGRMGGCSHTFSFFADSERRSRARFRKVEVSPLSEPECEEASLNFSTHRDYEAGRRGRFRMFGGPSWR
jgi:hypothetical protein